MDVNKFKELPVMGIVRGAKAGIIEPFTESVISGGLRAIEITMNTGSASDLIRRMVKTAKGRLTIGAGTVLKICELKSAIDAGATFIVSPTLVPEVVEHCAKNSIPVFPGALTPNEIYTAWRAGATMVKVFPSKFLGPAYFREIKGPFQDIELLACGGVTTENIRSFFQSGATAVAFGGSIFKKEWLSAGNFSNIEKNVRSLIAAGGFKPLKIINKA